MIFKLTCPKDEWVPVEISKSGPFSSTYFEDCIQVCLNSLVQVQNGRHFADNIFNCIFLNEKLWIGVQISLRFVSRSPIDNMSALVKITAWR